MEIPPKLSRSDAQWRSLLTEEQFRILRQKGTERPFTGTLLENRQTGAYHCSGCGELLFTSEAKFDAHCGWPSFSAPSTPTCVEQKEDLSHGMRRTEVLCARCGGHLGHLFTDGPKPAGLRYCINSAALQFERKS